MMVIENVFDIGEIVYLKTDREQEPRVIIELTIGDHYVAYTTSCGIMTTTHSALELTSEKNLIISL